MQHSNEQVLFNQFIISIFEKILDLLPSMLLSEKQRKEFTILIQALKKVNDEISNKINKKV
jgi:hypothetical protein